MQNAEVELYDNGSIIFLKGRVGIITTGSILIRKHSNNEIDGP